MSADYKLSTPFQPPNSVYPARLLYDVDWRCNVISLFFFFLSIFLIESVKHLIYNGAGRLSFSISLSLSAHDDGVYMRVCILHVRFVCLYVIFSVFFFFSLFLFLFFSLDCKRARERATYKYRAMMKGSLLDFSVILFVCMRTINVVRRNVVRISARSFSFLFLG
jgi:hypothetical protein